MDEIKNKVRELINKQQNRNIKIPAMGFSEYFIQNVAGTPEPVKAQKAKGPEAYRLSDQEILESIEEVYYEEDIDAGVYVLKNFAEDCDMNCDAVQRVMTVLRGQHKVVSKKVLQLILDKRSSCNEEFCRIGETEKKLEETLWVCKKARSYLSYAKKNLTTTSLEVLATYKKREVLMDLLKTLQTLKKLKSIDIQFQEVLADGKYSEAITSLLECKAVANENNQYKCVEALSNKLQDTLIATEVQLDEVLNEMTVSFDMQKYSKLQEAYKLLGKTMIAMDQLHMNFISAIHTTAFTIIRNCIEPTDDHQKMLFDKMCDQIPIEKFIPCLIELCKSFWSILVCYYQVTMWHQNYKISPTVDEGGPSSNINPDTQSIDEYIQEKLIKGQLRIWSDIQSKLCTVLTNTNLNALKYEQFIQVLSIVQRLNKVGLEFCSESSTKLVDCMRNKSIGYFNQYHATCLEEISLFLDNEAWMPVNSFCSVVQLQEFRGMKGSLQRHRPSPLKQQQSSETVVKKAAPTTTDNDNASSSHSQDGSSIYGSCGYFLRFSEKSSPFDGGFDESMLEEDILAGIADESSCYFSEESSDEREKSLEPAEIVAAPSQITTTNIIVNNSSLTVLRCIGRYLQMCRLLHSIAPQIVHSMTELIDFYVYVVHEVFGKDLVSELSSLNVRQFGLNTTIHFQPVPSENLYTAGLNHNLKRIADDIVPKVRNWPPTFGAVQLELCNPETMYGLLQRIVGVESCIALLQQFEQLRGYLEHLLPERQRLHAYFHETNKYIFDLRKPVYMCVTARVIDLQNILNSMAKVKWDINHVNIEHSAYVHFMNRGIQMFAMRLEEITAVVPKLPKESIWDCLAHVLTHTLIEGYSIAKKCTPGGRALMQLDFTHFMSILELISSGKYPVHQTYVDGYIKAYYMPHDLFEQWIAEQKDKKEYSIKQLSNLIQCTLNNDKKTRVKLLALVGNSSGGDSILNSP